MFALGLTLGSIFGIAFTCLCVQANRSDRALERDFIRSYHHDYTSR